MELDIAACKHSGTTLVTVIPDQPPNTMVTFLELPAEIRNKIYNYHESLRRHCDLDPASTSREKVAADRVRKLQSSLLEPTITRTNRKIRKETLPIFYGANIFVIRPTRQGGIDALRR